VELILREVFMKVSIIGAGKVGKTFGKLLKDAGYRIGGLVCRGRSRQKGQENL
jgi:prephenate dehydrogenase